MLQFASLENRIARFFGLGTVKMENDLGFRQEVELCEEALRSCRQRWSSLSSEAMSVGNQFVNTMLSLESVYIDKGDTLTKEKNEADFEKSSIEIERQYLSCLSELV
jgi:hypothetical protein